MSVTAPTTITASPYVAPNPSAPGGVTASPYSAPNASAPGGVTASPYVPPSPVAPGGVAASQRTGTGASLSVLFEGTGTDLDVAINIIAGETEVYVETLSETEHETLLASAGFSLQKTPSGSPSSPYTRREIWTFRVLSNSEYFGLDGNSLELLLTFGSDHTMSLITTNDFSGGSDTHPSPLAIT